jgi:hypothetical protein
MGGAFFRELKLDFVRIRHKKTICMSDGFFYYRVNNYFPLLASRMYFSKAIVIEGAFGDGAKISILKPLSSFV